MGLNALAFQSDVKQLKSNSLASWQPAPLAVIQCSGWRLIYIKMKLKDENRWNDYVSKNTDPYGGACVKVARRVMELLDEDPTPLHNGYYPDIHTAHGLICKADDDTNAGGITGFMAGCVAQMVFECHERGDEFRKSHNGEEYEGESVVNHALLTIRSKD